MKKTKEQKITAAKRNSILVAIALSLVLLISGTLALFTSRSSSDFKAQAGTVVLEVVGLNLTNSTNINPGDNDPANSGDEYTEGTPHEFSYSVYATGTKSSRTRQTILLTVDKKGESTDSLDASVLKLFVHGTEEELFAEEVIDEETGIVIQGRYYILSNDEEIKDLSELDKLREKDETLFVKAVKYTFMGNIYDGLGVDIKKGGNAEKEDPEKLISIVPDVKLIQEDEDGNIKEDFIFDFGMMRTASNKYQGADIYIDVIAESMQYRNTNDTDWALTSQVNKIYSTSKAQLKTVPATNENKWGDELYESENKKQSEYDESVSISISESIEAEKNSTESKESTESISAETTESSTSSETTESVSETIGEPPTLSSESTESSAVESTESISTNSTESSSSSESAESSTVTSTESSDSVESSGNDTDTNN